MEKMTTNTAGDPKRSGDLFTAEGATVFVPLNREAAVSVLGSLCVSDVPVAEVSLPTQGHGLILLDDGLRSSEADLVSGGDRRRFPVLLEFPVSSVRKAKSGEVAFGLSHLTKIIFRNSTEAEEFRFRPFDELDAEALPHAVEPEKFGWAGEPRFSMRPPDRRSALASVVDRFAAGIHDVLVLAESHAPARAAAADFLQTPADSGGLGLRACWSTAAGNESDGGVLGTVVRAFGSGDSRLEIIDRICRELGATDAKAARVWGEIARGVQQNRVQLTGEHLSDDGSIPLRAALLALSADSPAALVTFLKSDQPPGQLVTVSASFLVGMKTGLLNLSWGQKKEHLPRLSALAAVLLMRAVGDRHSALDALSVESVEGLITVRCDGQSLAEWADPEEAARKVIGRVEPRLKESVEDGLAREGYVVQGPGSEPGTYRFVLAGRSISLAVALDEQDPSCVLMFALDANSKFRKKSEIAAAFSRPGMLWRPGPPEASERFLFCELPHAPQRADAHVLSAKLEGAVNALLVSPKDKKVAAPRARRAKAAPAESPTADLLAQAPPDPDARGRTLA